MALAPAEIEHWYVKYGPMVYRRCRKLLSQDEWACEAMQDVFVKVLRQAEHLDGSSPSSLLYRVATNVCLNLIRDRGVRPETADGELIETIAHSHDLEGESSVRHLLDALFVREVESTRVLAVLHLVDGLTLEEVASVSQLSVSGVRKRLSRLRQRLLALTEDHRS